MTFRKRQLAYVCVSVMSFVVLVAPGKIWAEEREVPEELVRQGTVVGRVVDREGRPVAKARVWLQENRNSTLVEGRTDANGQFVLRKVPPGSTTNCGWRGGYARLSRPRSGCLRRPN